MNKKNILITGGAGFIGSNMAIFQLERGNDVWIVDSLITGRMSNIEPYLSRPEIRFDHADISSWPNLLKAVEWADEIYHFAASVGQRFVLKNPIYTITNNIRACEEILNAMDQVNSKARLLIVSTSELYCHSIENPDGTVSEDAIMSFLPNNFLQDTYPVGKFANEVTALSYVYEKGFHCSIARIFNTIGVNQSLSYGMVVPNFIEQATSNKPITVFGDGLQTRSFSDVRDTITALDLLLKTPKSKGEIVNVGNDKECRIIDLANLIRRKTNSKSEIVHISYEEAYGVPFTDVRRRQPDLRKLKRLTGFEQKWTLEDTIDYILAARTKELAKTKK
jgi:UDP-glucose 4-epimerase